MNNQDIATKYLGRALITLIIGIILVILAALGCNSNMSITNKGIEVHTLNSNSTPNFFE